MKFYQWFSFMFNNDSANLHILNTDLIWVEYRVFELLPLVSWRLRVAFMCWLRAVYNLKTFFNSIWTYLDIVILIF